VSDIFQEVEEDIRRERWESIWKRYGHYIIAAAAAVILGVAAYKAWTAYDLSQRQQASDRFRTAEAFAATGQVEKAQTEFAALAKDAPEGYSALAKFRLAGIFQNTNKRADAVALLRDLSNGSDPILTDAAKIRLAWMLAESAPRGEVDALLAPLKTPDHPWRANADEISAYLDLQAGNRLAAIDAYERLAKDTAAPETMRQRSGAIAQHLKANPQGLPASQETKPQ